MSFLSTSFKTQTSAKLPEKFTREAVLGLLHNHALMISLNPLILSHNLLKSVDNPPSPYPTNTYEIVDKVDGLGSWTKRFTPDTVTYQIDVTNTEDGMGSVVKAPMGILSHITWKLLETAEGLILEETGEVECHRIVGRFIKGAIEDSHKKFAETLIEKLEVHLP